MEIFWIILGFIALIFLFGIRIVGQNTVLVIEFLGKFRRTMVAGLNYKIPLLERVAENVSLRQQNFAIKGLYPSNDKVIIDVSTNLIFSVDSALDGVKKYVYSLTNRAQSIGAVVENSLRTYIAKETHEGILEKKEELAAHIRGDMEKQFSEWGMIIYSFQITGVSFPATITQAMSEVVASEQLKKAAMNKGEATKIQAVKEAEGERERKRLQGEGIAMEREAIAKGLKESIDIVRGSTNQSSSEILALLTLTQYLDTLKTIGTADNSKVIFLDTNVNKTSDLMQQLTSAMEISKDKKKV
ncbi:MAG: SPFH domain-containing protein [Patescibacteria group bacterium]|nr:SPFH domain-containing protein [Patescibacteria group bacterium]